MQTIAHYGLGLGIITSALGAFLLCLLVFRYGFTPPDDESPEERSRRQFVTRLGHAAGAVCFALTAGLSAVVLGVSDRQAAEAPASLTADASPRLRALSTENQRLGQAVHTLGERMTEAEAMMQRLRVTSSETETALQRLRATASETSAKIDRLERGTTIARAATPPSVREARHPGLERPDPTPGAPRRSMPVTEVFTPVLRPAAVSTPAPRPVMLPPADASPSVIVPEPQATTTPDVRPDPPEPASSPRTAAVVEPAPQARPQVVAERATSVAVSARAPESGGVDSASRGVTRFGDIFARGVLNLGKSIRRFVEDLQ